MRRAEEPQAAARRTAYRARNAYAAPAWAAEQRVGDVGTKATLLILANYADENFSCFPGQETIARETEQSVSTVRRQLKRLVGLGLVSREHRYDDAGRRTSDRYYLNLDVTVDVTQDKKDTSLPVNLTGSEPAPATTPPVTPEPPVDNSPPSAPADGHYRSNQGSTTGQIRPTTRHSYDGGTPSRTPRGRKTLPPNDRRNGSVRARAREDARREPPDSGTASTSTTVTSGSAPPAGGPTTAEFHALAQAIIGHVAPQLPPQLRLSTATRNTATAEVAKKLRAGWWEYPGLLEDKLLGGWSSARDAGAFIGRIRRLDARPPIVGDVMILGELWCGDEEAGCSPQNPMITSEDGSVRPCMACRALRQKVTARSA